MKKLILIPLLILIFFAGCKEEIGENNNFTLKIQFAQSVNDTVRISYRDVEGAESTAEVVITNGEGSLNDSTCHPFWARFNSRSFRNNGGFLLSAGEVTLKLDTSNYGKSVTGSPANTEIEQQFKNFSTELKDSASHYLALRSKLRKEVGGDVYGPMEDSLNFLYEKMVHFNNLREIEYISTYPKSYVSLAKARGMYKSAVSYDKVKSLYELLDVDRQNDIVGRELFEKVKIAEKTGLIIDIGLFVIEEAFKTMQQWSIHKIEISQLSINVSMRQFFYQSFTDDVKRLSQQYLSPGVLASPDTAAFIHKDRDR